MRKLKSTLLDLYMIKWSPWLERNTVCKWIQSCQSNLMVCKVILLYLPSGVNLWCSEWCMCSAPSPYSLSIIKLLSVKMPWYLQFNRQVNVSAPGSQFALWKLPWCWGSYSAAVQSTSKGSPASAGLLTHSDQETVGPGSHQWLCLMQTTWRQILIVRRALSSSSPLFGESMRKLALH